ncbi:MAG: outer membrane lipoprotein chaperone LolA [Deltaproteobacteria bacterium]|nr:outer membrane lipoprotein chaperone LolA [Deltaproteobacteria bacterium]
MLMVAAAPGTPIKGKTEKPALLAQAAKTPPKAPPQAKATAQPSAEAVLEKVQKYYASIDDYQAEFIQDYTKVALSRSTESRGTLMLKKPSFMRWTYTQPAEKLWVVDGDTLYVVDPEFEQVFVDKGFKTEELQNSISFLWGRGKLSSSFNATLGKPTAPGTAVLELTPKKGASYSKMLLVVNAETGEVTESIIHETAGNTNHFKFRNAKLNQGLKDDLFKYSPPEGYEVIVN